MAPSITKPSCPALRLLDAENLHDGRAAAVNLLARAPRCGCCTSLRVHVASRIGSLLFLEDDPTQLARAFPVGEQALYTPRLLAACILAYGRARVDL